MSKLRALPTMMSVKDSWKEHWQSGSELEDHGTWIGNYLRKKRLDVTSKILSELDKNLSVIDMGCGGGRTLHLIRNAGFNNSIGIDFIEESMIHCEEQGFKREKDIFLIDAKQTPYKDRQFDIGFSEGLWEHFPEPEPYIREAARITDKYILVIQPDHYSLFGMIMKIGWEILSKNKGGVREYSFKISYFEDELKKYGFKLIKKTGTIFMEQAILLFERQED